MEKNKIAIVIPAFNEEKTIISVVLKAKKYGVPLVVNDGSTDGTEKLLLKRNIKVIKNDKNSGYHFSIKKGIKYAYSKKYKYIITYDADGQHKITDLKRTLEYLKKNDLVYTERKKYGRSSERIFSLFSNTLFKVKDPLSGLKGYKRNIFFNYKFNFNENLFGSEILINSINRNFKIKKFDIKVYKRKDKSRVGHSLLIDLQIFMSCFLLLKKYFIDKI